MVCRVTWEFSSGMALVVCGYVHEDGIQQHPLTRSHATDPHLPPDQGKKALMRRLPFPMGASEGAWLVLCLSRPQISVHQGRSPMPPPSGIMPQRKGIRYWGGSLRSTTGSSSVAMRVNAEPCCPGFHPRSRARRIHPATRAGPTSESRSIAFSTRIAESGSDSQSLRNHDSTGSRRTISYAVSDSKI